MLVCVSVSDFIQQQQRKYVREFIITNQPTNQPTNQTNKLHPQTNRSFELETYTHIINKNCIHFSLLILFYILYFVGWDIQKKKLLLVKWLFYYEKNEIIFFIRKKKEYNYQRPNHNDEKRNNVTHTPCIYSLLIEFVNLI